MDKNDITQYNMKRQIEIVEFINIPILEPFSKEILLNMVAQHLDYQPIIKIYTDEVFVGTPTQFLSNNPSFIIGVNVIIMQVVQESGIYTINYKLVQEIENPQIEEDFALEQLSKIISNFFKSAYIDTETKQEAETLESKTNLAEQESLVFNNLIVE